MPELNIPPAPAVPWDADLVSPPVPPRVAPISIDESEVTIYRDVASLTKALAPYPKQVLLVIAVRAAKRAAVLLRYRRTAIEAATAGIPVADHFAFLSRGMAETHCAELAAGIAKAQGAALAVDAAGDDAARFARGHLVWDPQGALARETIWLRTADDLHRIAKVRELQKTGGVALTGWDDPRLDPLWPDGAPEWHRLVEGALTELKAKLAARPDPFAPPVPAEARQPLDDYRALNGMCDSGELGAYSGQYVFVHGGKIVGNGPNLRDARKAAAEKCGAPEGEIAYRYVY